MEDTESRLIPLLENDKTPIVKQSVSDGLEELLDIYIEPDTGDRWMNITKDNLNQFHENWNVDEYGDRSYMWDYR